MINKIQYLRTLPVVNMPGLNVSAITTIDPDQIAPDPTAFGQLTSINSTTVVPNTTTTTTTVVNTATASIITTTTTTIPTAPTSALNSSTTNSTLASNLIFHSINDLNSVSNQPLVHDRDDAGNIILINDTASNNQLLTIESITYTVPNITLDAVIDTQFNYFKFPPTFNNIDESGDVSLTETIEDVDLLSTRYTPSTTSGRQTGLGRKPTLRAGLMINEGIDDANVNSYPSGYYNEDYKSQSILNMESVLGGVGQLKPSIFIITPDMIEKGENIFFKIRIAHWMKRENNNSLTCKFNAYLRRRNPNTGQVTTAMNASHLENVRYFTGPITGKAYNIRDAITQYNNQLAAYNNALALYNNRTTTQQQQQLQTLKNQVTTAKNNYDLRVSEFITSQENLNTQIYLYTNDTYSLESVPTPDMYDHIYTMYYLIDIRFAKPYEEYQIDTQTGTGNNAIVKENTYWQIVPVSKIKNAL